ncbi:hypothetical protein OI25_7735 [Paraburkholderia fungorum]|uniref:Uncharacterized protein n=1 Tax=Paraburkholderia fungorum TaxID=134537 RepID=A0AAP5QH99_9BURK|nr:hypothetical protein [Paraburkholderia fungorum]AJZ57076.1 hypothetical protein OI25_7735 [Paraburkholderia fungorum]MDT8843486.1 hypothetical protein [Paraburkholderia fungorum]PRZ45510.1 hypothetical protein BX589_13825 [Paraburkholderia fungorum]
MDAASYHAELRLHGAEGQMARCPFCRREMMIVENEGEWGFQFFHRQHFSSSPCPLTTSAVQPPVLFARGLPDIDVESVNREAFIANWRSHFAVMVGQVNSLSVDRFVNLISVADVLHLWSYRDLDPNDIPFVLLVLAEVMTDTTVGHEKMWVRFVFEGRIKTVSDLRAEPEMSAKLYRIQYRPHKNTRMPNARDIVVCAEVERPLAPLDSCAVSISDSDEALFEKLMETVDLDLRSRHATPF